MKLCRLHPGHGRALFVPRDPDCRCKLCIDHRREAIRSGRCSESCVVCFDAIDRGVCPVPE